MAYGLKCLNVSGYTTFDSTVLTSFLKVTASGTVTVAGSSTSATIVANEVDYIYVWTGEINTYSETAADRYQITNRLTNSFKIQNLKTVSRTFYYIAFTR
jgi:hypothetical protein